MARILAIDIGSKLCGLAWSDPLQIIASHLNSVDRRELIKTIETLLKDGTVETIVVGYPKKLNGEPTHMTAPAEALKQELEKKFNLPVVLWDERFTSQMAFNTLLESNVSKKKRQDKDLINAVSATIILQSYLDSLPRK